MPVSTEVGDCHIEDLNIKGLMKNRKLARSFSDAALGKLLNLLTSKVEHRGGVVVKIHRFFPLNQILSLLWLEMGRRRNGPFGSHFPVPEPQACLLSFPAGS